MASDNGSPMGASVNPNAQKVAPKGLHLELTLMDSGVMNEIPSTTDLLVAGQPVSQPALDAELKSDIHLFQAVIDAQTQLQTARAARKAAIQAVRQRYKEIRAALIVRFGSGNPVLQKFGILPPKPRKQLTAEEKAVKNAKAKLTRGKRHTMGSKQKSMLKTIGTPTVEITPDGTTVIPPPGETQPPTTGSTSGTNASGAANGSSAS